MSDLAARCFQLHEVAMRFWVYVCGNCDDSRLLLVQWEGLICLATDVDKDMVRLAVWPWKEISAEFGEKMGLEMQ